MNCTTCNWPHTPHELHVGVCLKCVGGELEALRQRYDDVLNEMFRNNNRHAELLGLTVNVALRISKQRDAAVKAARRWKARAEVVK